MTASPDKLDDLRRQLEEQETQLSLLTQSLDPELADRIARLSNSVLEQLDDVVGSLSAVRHPTIPVMGLRA